MIDVCARDGGNVDRTRAVFRGVRRRRATPGGPVGSRSILWLGHCPIGGDLFDCCKLLSAGSLQCDAMRTLSERSICARRAVQGIPCMYLEAENVTCAQCAWGIGGSCPYLWKLNGTRTCTPEPPRDGYDLPGADFRQVRECPFVQTANTASSPPCSA